MIVTSFLGNKINVLGVALSVFIDSSFSEIFVDQIACHQSGLTVLCVNQKLVHLFSKTTCNPFDETLHWSICFGDAFDKQKIR